MAVLFVYVMLTAFKLKEILAQQELFEQFCEWPLKAVSKVKATHHKPDTFLRIVCCDIVSFLIFFKRLNSLPTIFIFFQVLVFYFLSHQL